MTEKTKKVFTLEALQARDGDCLLLHYGSDRDRRLILIDGGPTGTYKSILKPRLDQLRGEGPLDLRLAMVSHIDLDHITGILDLLKNLYERQSDGKPKPYCIQSLWHNSFGKLAGTTKVTSENGVIAAAVNGGSINLARLKKKVNAVVASVKQGADVRDYAIKLGIRVNVETRGQLVRAPKTGRKTIPIDSDAGLTFTVLGPREVELRNLENEWEKSKKEAKQNATPEGIAADYLNRTIPNLSSIVILAELKVGKSACKRLLLTGDAGGDFILEGLESSGLLRNGKIHVDLLKVQHHGSAHSNTQDFFEKVTADSYVISGDGKHGNPSIKVLKWLSAARSRKKFNTYFTNRKLRENLTKPLDEFLKAEARDEAGHKYHFRNERSLSISVPI